MGVGSVAHFAIEETFGKKFMNLLVIPSLLVGFILFTIGEHKYKSTNRFKFTFIAIALIFAIPGISFVLFYLHWFDNWISFYKFRALTGTEVLSGGVGLLFGVLSKILSIHKIQFKFVSLFLTFIVIIVPHVKPLVAPISVKTYRNTWKDNVCLQSTSSTCGPSCCATILKLFNIRVSEQDIAKECFSYRGGTEIWYIARALRNRGLKAVFKQESKDITQIPFPSIAGIKFKNGVGHFITILNEENNNLIIGDPLSGQYSIDKAKAITDIGFTGFFLTVEK